MVMLWNIVTQSDEFKTIYVDFQNLLIFATYRQTGIKS